MSYTLYGTVSDTNGLPSANSTKSRLGDDYYDDDSGGESKHNYAMDNGKYYVDVDP